MERKDGGWGLLYCGDGLLRFEADGRCNGTELFRGGKFTALGRRRLLFVTLWKMLGRERCREGKDTNEEEGFERIEERDHQGREEGGCDMDIDMDSWTDREGVKW
jgi:hypothetical protein